MSRSTSYSLFSSLPRIEWTHEFRYEKLSVARGDRYAGWVERAAAFCFDALASTWECETGAFWSTVDCNDLFVWLQADEPALAAAISQATLETVLERRVMSLVNLMRSVESDVGVMKPDAVEIILMCGDYEHQLGAVLEYLDSDGGWIYEDGDQAQFEGWYDDEEESIYHVDEDCLASPGYGSWAREAAAKETLKILLGKAASHATCCERVVQTALTAETSDIVEEIRETTFSENMLFLLDSRTLPRSLMEQTKERMCFAVTISDTSLANIQRHAGLVGDANIPTCVFRDAWNGAPVPLFRLAGHLVWVDAKRTIDHLQKVRREVAVLFVGTKACCLVKYRFNHFEKLRRLYNDYNRAKREPHLYEQVDSRHLKALENTLGCVPSVRHQVVDLTNAEAFVD